MFVELEDLERMRTENGDALRRSPGMSLSSDVRVRHRDGGLRWCQLSMTNRLDDSVISGIVVNVQRKLGVPVKLVGLGEGPDDLAPFDPQAFVDAIVG